MQSSRLMPMVTVRTSRLSCVNISMVSRMSPVFIMLIVVCLSFVAAEGSPSGGNNDDRRQWRKQGVAVGAAASRMRGPHQGPKQTLGAATRAVARRRRDGEV